LDFYEIVKEDPNEKGYTFNPYAGKVNGEWLEGYTSIDFLNKQFGKYETAEQMINATESEGFKLYFTWLKEKGILN